MKVAPSGDVIWCLTGMLAEYFSVIQFSVISVLQRKCTIYHQNTLLKWILPILLAGIILWWSLCWPVKIWCLCYVNHIFCLLLVGRLSLQLVCRVNHFSEKILPLVHYRLFNTFTNNDSFHLCVNISCSLEYRIIISQLFVFQFLPRPLLLPSFTSFENFADDFEFLLCFI